MDPNILLQAEPVSEEEVEVAAEAEVVNNSKMFYKYSEVEVEQLPDQLVKMYIFNQVIQCFNCISTLYFL